MTTRPPASIRYLVLFIAVVCLFCIVCARSRAPVSAPAQVTPGSEPATVPVDAAPPEPTYFPATKAPGHLFQGGSR